MTVESNPAMNTPVLEPEEPLPTYLVGRLISLRFVTAALRRRRHVWVGLAIVGLALGGAYHVVVPRQYEASATLYLAHVPGSDDNVDMANDLALLQTTAVGERAVKLLHEPSLGPAKLLGKAPGTADSVNVLTITVSGPTKGEAVRRVNALATVFLAFRSEQGRLQTAASTDALQRQIQSLNAQINQLTGQINALNSATQGANLDTLVGDRSTDTSQVVTLEQTVQQDQLNGLAVANGSTVLTPGAALPSSTVKLFGLDGISGLLGGLILGLGLVSIQALVSDRIYSRAEVTALLGANVALSIPRGRRRPGRSRRRVERMAAGPSPEASAFADYLRGRCGGPSGRTSLLVVAVDRVEIPAAALAVAAARLAAEGRSVLVAYLTHEQVLAGLIDAVATEVDRAGKRDAGKVSLFVGPVDGEGADLTDSGADVVLALATVDPGSGAWDLNWATEAILAVSAGESSALRLSTTAELLRAAGLSISTAVLLNADENDETVGLVMPAAPVPGRSLEVVPTTPTRP